MWLPYASTCTGSSIEAAARPVRNPPSSCLSAWVAPCMRRFNSLMSNLPVDITLSLVLQTFLANVSCKRLLQTSRRATLHSAGNDGAASRPAQDRADRTRFGDREYDDRQRRLAGKRECGRVHDLVAALQRLRVGQAVKARGQSILLRIGAVDSIDIGRLQHGLRIDFGGAQHRRGVGGEERIAGAAAKQHDAAFG